MRESRPGEAAAQINAPIQVNFARPAASTSALASPSIQMRTRLLQESLKGSSDAPLASAVLQLTHRSKSEEPGGDDIVAS